MGKEKNAQNYWIFSVCTFDATFCIASLLLLAAVVVMIVVVSISRPSSSDVYNILRYYWLENSVLQIPFKIKSRKRVHTADCVDTLIFVTVFSGETCALRGSWDSDGALDSKAKQVNKRNGFNDKQ